MHGSRSFLRTLFPALLLVAAATVVFAPGAAASPATAATFSGTATIHLVFMHGAGTMTFQAPFSVTVAAGGPAVGRLFLTVTSPMLIQLFHTNTVTVGGFVATGSIVVSAGSASGGGTIAPPEASLDGFGVTGMAGGQFQCQNAGFTALTMFGIQQMDVHGTVGPSNLMIS